MLVTSILSWYHLREVIELLPVPDWSNMEATRQWCQRAIAVHIEIASETANTWDDKIAAAEKAIADSPEAFAAFYGLVVDILDGNDAELQLRATAVAEQLSDEKAKIDPATIIAIITAAIELIKMWRERRQTKDDAPELAA